MSDDSDSGEKKWDNTNRGAAFPNKRKASPNHADYSGTLNVGGAEYWMNIWVKKRPDNSSYLSVSIRKKEPRTLRTLPNEREDDEIPF